MSLCEERGEGVYSTQTVVITTTVIASCLSLTEFLYLRTCESTVRVEDATLA